MEQLKVRLRDSSLLYKAFFSFVKVSLHQLGPNVMSDLMVVVMMNITLDYLVVLGELLFILYRLRGIVLTLGTSLLRTVICVWLLGSLTPRRNGRSRGIFQLQEVSRDCQVMMTFLACLLLTKRYDGTWNLGLLHSLTLDLIRCMQFSQGYQILENISRYNHKNYKDLDLKFICAY